MGLLKRYRNGPGRNMAAFKLLFLTSPANFCRERKWIRAFLSVNGERPFQRALYVAFHHARTFLGRRPLPENVYLAKRRKFSPSLTPFSFNS